MKTTLNAINEAALNPEEFVKECEKTYLKQIFDVAKHISDDDDIKIVAIAGPSASGKTTTAHILMRELEKLDEKTAVVSLDDFYKELNDLPFLSDGSRDYESINSLDLNLIEEKFKEIIESGKTKLPVYEFASHKRINDAKSLDVGKRGIVIVEGLHALNDKISGLVNKKNIYKIYISVNSSIDDEDGIEMLSSRQVRLIRRVLRDDRFRGSDVKDTLSLWNNVVEGEIKHLYPFKQTADCMISTLHPYELCVYHERFCKLRGEVTRNTPWYDYFIKTVNALELFDDIAESTVPKDSLIREFLG